MNRPKRPDGDTCPECGSPGSQVRDSRPVDANLTRRRRRRLCEKCGARWTTIELPEWELITHDELIRQLDELQIAIGRLRDRIKAQQDDLITTRQD